MRLRTFTVYFWGFLIAAAAVAVDDPVTSIDIDVDGGELDSTTTPRCGHELHVIETAFDAAD